MSFDKPHVLVSVVMATYNHAEYIRQAMDSLCSQKCRSDLFEIIVINDGSTDNTSEILRTYAPHIRLVERDNRGLVASCNEGLALARGRYFARLDSDDYADATWLTSLLEVLEENPSAVCAVPDLLEIRNGQEFYSGLDVQNVYTLQACGTLFRTDAILAAGGFRAFYWEEFDLYLRLRRIGPFVHLPRPLYFYRKHPGGMTHNRDRRMQGWIELAQTWGFDHLRSAGHHEELTVASEMYEAGKH